MASVPPIHLVLDWDGTTTHKDTLHFLGKICADHARSRSDGPATTTWDDIVKAYVDDLSSHASSYTPEKGQRTTIAEEKAWLASLATVDSLSVRRVEDSGLFKGVTAAAVRTGAAQAIGTGELTLRDGWSSLLAQGQKTTILSVNWSATFIRECLLAAAANDSDLKAAVERVSIAANEIAGLQDSNGSSGLLNGRNEATGDETGAIRTSADKFANMPTPVKYGGEELVVYVGDSTTDLEALLVADVGICIRDEEPSSGQQELAEALERVGVEQHRIKLLAEMPPADDSIVRVYWAKNLREVALSLSSYY
ncbi:nuclease-like protein [Diplodia corticola]|uniref:Nuclease-like protein n=1 Tax=Diplodia corticola TaxID=236234 RepID=A0A1J9QWC2_9PEZI|nr:nuclease-like protein [Diplodia corticola]OJD32728.1 nuclease-like protein [Diplodia corticola]